MDFPAKKVGKYSYAVSRLCMKPCVAHVRLAASLTTRLKKVLFCTSLGTTQVTSTSFDGRFHSVFLIDRSIVMRTAIFAAGVLGCAATGTDGVAMQFADVNVTFGAIPDSVTLRTRV